MRPEDIRKLLGGYATGTLTAEERQALFEAALDDQALFDALAKEQPLRDLLDENQEAAQQHGHRLELHVLSALAPVRAVDRLLREAVANYLSNAFKYATKTSTVVLAARQSAGVLRIEVIDEGPGINPTEQGQLFREFSRLKSSGRDRGGIGLGLSIVRRIAEVHGGRAGVESVVGQGSAFFIELPVECR